MAGKWRIPLACPTAALSLFLCPCPAVFSLAFFLKLAVAPLAVWLASIASRRYGHVIGGILSGFPMIAAPVTAALLLDQSAITVSKIAYASVGSLPATLGFITGFAWVAKQGKAWWICLGSAAASFFLIAALLQFFSPPTFVSVAMGCSAPWLGAYLMPKRLTLSKLPAIPRTELFLRIVGAAAMAGVLILGAANTPAWISGLLMAWPITGSILPVFTQKLSGPNATIALLFGFSRGLVGFSVFFTVLGGMLEIASKPVSFCTALTAAILVAALLVKRSQ
jgi:hypothetical protein